MKTIKGSTNPKAEEKTFYELSDFIYHFENPLFGKKENEKHIWTLYKQVNNNWKQVSGNIKYGEKVPYTFGERAVGISFKIEVHTESKNFLNKIEKKLTASLVVVPRTKHEPVIGRVILLNRDNADVNKATFNESLSAEARTSNLVGKEITFYLWEEGATEEKKYQKPKTAKVDKNGIAKIKFSLSEYATPQTWMSFFSGNDRTTKKFFVTASYLSKETTNRTPVSVTESQQQQQPQQQIEKKEESAGLIEKVTDIIAEGIGKIGDYVEEKTRTATSVGSSDVQENNDGECPRCTKLTESELKAVFPNVFDTDLITEIVNSFNTYCEKFNVNTCTLKAHFFAQAKQESGDSLSPAVKGESMDYGIAGLKSTGFKNVSTSYLFGDKNGIKMAEELGRKKDEKSLSIDRQIKIANFVYGLDPKAEDLGNKAPTDNQSLSESDNEGWRYRGRGMLQITGKRNYVDIENHVNKVLGKVVLDIKEGRKYDGKFTATEALLSGLGDWDLHKMHIPAKIGLTKEACLNVIKIINSKTKSKTKRVANLIAGKWYVDDDTTKKAHTIKEENSMKSIFRVDECLRNGGSKKIDEKPINSKVIIKFGSNADKTVVSEKSLNILREVGEQTRNYLINITSTARDPYNQARVMYDNIVKKGMRKQRATYKEPGQQVLNSYESAHAKGKDREGIIAEMEAKIKEIGPSKVSRHCGDPKILNVFDVSQALSNPQDFKRVITQKIQTVLDENGCYHLEIKQ